MWARIPVLWLAAGSWWAPLNDAILSLRDLGPAGAIPFAGITVVGMLLLAPAVPFPLAAGFLYGPVLGFFAAWIGELLAAMVAWGLGRSLLRGSARRLTERYPLFGALDRAIQHGGFRLLVLVRMSPLFPFGPVNYFLGVTGVRPLRYLGATAVGLAPLCLLLAWVGSTLTHLSDVLTGDTDLGATDNVIRWVGVVASILVVGLVTRATKKALVQELDTD